MKLVQLYGIAFDCPKLNITFGRENKSREKECPLSVIDTFTIVEKVNWIEELTDDDVARILKYHSNCINKCL